MTQAEIQAYRQSLLRLAARFSGEVVGLRGEALRTAGCGPSSLMPEQADPAGHESEEDVALRLLGTEEEVLAQVNEALDRIERGTFGRCLECGKPIPKDRLRVLPYARHCVACARRHESESLP